MLCVDEKKNYRIFIFTDNECRDDFYGIEIELRAYFLILHVTYFLILRHIHIYQQETPVI